MQTIEVQGLTFSVETEPDSSVGPPWKEFDGHGPVSEWTTRDKRPGERVLAQDRNSFRYYDVQGAMEQAKLENWGLGPDALVKLTKELGREPTAGEIRAAAVKADYEYLRAWCNDEWNYVTVKVQLLDIEGEPVPGVPPEYCGGVESLDEAHVLEIARESAAELIAREGISKRRKTFERSYRIRR